MLRRPGGDREMADILALVLHHDEQVVSGLWNWLWIKASRPRRMC